MKKESLILIITIALLALWIPVVIDKAMEFRKFEAGIMRQPLPFGLARIVVWTILPLEFITVILLLNTSTRTWGMHLSLFLMILFTGYVGLTVLGAWERTSCQCGSLISSLSWTQHFWFNLFFTIVSAAGIYIIKKQHSFKGFVAIKGESGQPQVPIKHI